MRTIASIPVPTFETTISNVPPSSPPAAALCWNHLLQVEAALQLHFNNRKNLLPSEGSRKKNIISLDEFYELVNKLKLSWTLLSSAGDTKVECLSQIHNDQPPLLLSSTEEQVLHDLLCITDPILYRMVSPFAHGDDQSGSANQSSLESVEFSGNRLIELKKLLHQLDHASPTWTSKSALIISRIEAHRQSQQQKQQQEMDTLASDKSNSNTSTRHSITKASKMMNGPFSEPYIHAGMSLEERVRARAAANKNRKVNTVNKDSATSSLSSSSPPSSSSSLLLAYADALWSHARNIMSRYQASIRYRLSSSSAGGAHSTAAPNTCCIMTLKDVVEVLSRTTANQQAAAAASRRQMVDAVQELAQLAPEWIILTDPGNEDQHTAKKDAKEVRRLSKQTTVWIRPVEYRTIRAKLGGTGSAITSTANNSSADDAAEATPAATVEPTAAVISPDTSMKPAAALIIPAVSVKPAAAVIVPGASLKPTAALVDTHMKPEDALIDSSTRNSNRIPPDRSLQATPATKRARTGLDPSATASVQGGDENPIALGSSIALSTRSSVKRLLLDGNNQEKKKQDARTPSKLPPQRFKKGLRINKNLILTDADYDGGEIIEPTQFDSPRGLKRLFEQLNSGQRI